MPDQPAINWGAEALWEQLVPLLPGLSVEVVHRVASTNTTLLERARAVPDMRADGSDVLVRRSIESGAFGRRAIDLQPCLLVAEQQTSGRGRQGRPWQSKSGASLTFSLGLPLATTDWSGLSLAVGVALGEALAPMADDRSQIGLKWPNDLWLMDGPVQHAAAGRKLGGILIETVSAGTQRLAIIGIGLNVLPFDAPELKTGFASLHELDAGVTAPQVLAMVALPLVQALQQFEREGFAAFGARFATRDVLLGRTVRTSSSAATEGIARGVSAQGALLIESSAGIVSATSGEVSVRLATGP